MRELRGKVSVVTGAGAGIGRATALALSREGATVAVCDLDIAAAKESAHQIESAGGGAERPGIGLSSSRSAVHISASMRS